MTGHKCVDHCQPPEHADLCYCGAEWDKVGNHLVFEADYWQLYRVNLTKVQRVPEFDNQQEQLQGFVQIPIRRGDTVANKAFIVRWRADAEREPNRLKRLHAIQHVYGKCTFPRCDFNQRDRAEAVR